MHVPLDNPLYISNDSVVVLPKLHSIKAVELSLLPPAPSEAKMFRPTSKLNHVVLQSALCGPVPTTQSQLRRGPKGRTSQEGSEAKVFFRDRERRSSSSLLEFTRSQSVSRSPPHLVPRPSSPLAHSLSHSLLLDDSSSPSRRHLRSLGTPVPLHPLSFL